MTYLDVRTLQEFASGSYPGAIHFDVERIAAGSMPNLPYNEEIRVFCRSGNRAEFARIAMQAAGFIHVINLGGVPSV